MTAPAASLTSVLSDVGGLFAASLQLSILARSIVTSLAADIFSANWPSACNRLAAAALVPKSARSVAAFKRSDWYLGFFRKAAIASARRFASSAVAGVTTSGVMMEIRA